jgi:hypothetical protein
MTLGRARRQWTRQQHSQTRLPFTPRLAAVVEGFFLSVGGVAQHEW